MGLWCEGAVERRQAPGGVQWNRSAFGHHEERAGLIRISCSSGEATAETQDSPTTSRRPGGRTAVTRGEGC